MAPVFDHRQTGVTERPLVQTKYERRSDHSLTCPTTFQVVVDLGCAEAVVT
jgi:hypothetical protein